MVAKDEPMPTLYKDPAYSKLNRWCISTSNLSSEYFENWGWGEVVEDGIGVRIRSESPPWNSVW